VAKASICMYNYHVRRQKFNAAGLINLLNHYAPSDETEQFAKTQMLWFVQQYPDFHRRNQLIGHTTASAWIVSEDLELILLNHHFGLNRWMQLGGHIEDDLDIHAAAMREAQEESGLTSLTFASKEIFDLDIHEIPLSLKAPVHNHYDIRFLLIADPSEPLKITLESKALEWCTPQTVRERTSERSILRMLEKTELERRESNGDCSPHT